MDRVASLTEQYHTMISELVQHIKVLRAVEREETHDSLNAVCKQGLFPYLQSENIRLSNVAFACAANKGIGCLHAQSVSVFAKCLCECHHGVTWRIVFKCSLLRFAE
jgi:hypothetical protein